MSTTTIAIADVRASLDVLMAELIDGGPGDWVFFTDGPKAGGVAAALAAIPAHRAFTDTIPADRHTPAALASHMLYSADLFARALRGDHSGYEHADWQASWAPPDAIARAAATDPAAAWADLSARLLDRLRDAKAALADCCEFDQFLTRTGSFGNVAHFAYHLAELRRMGRAMAA